MSKSDNKDKNRGSDHKKEMMNKDQRIARLNKIGFEWWWSE